MTLNTRIAPALARALEKKGFSTLTEVQESVLAPEADGADLLVSAQTGSGKTAAFGLAIAPTLLGDAERFERGAEPMALIVAPTRELALQVQRELVWLYGETGARVVTCVGGMDTRTERRALEAGCHIVVGTPGRLRDHIERGALDLSSLRAVVLDEADEMLDFGFREDLEYILDAAPASRRTLMFSATVPRSIADMAKRYQRDAVRISTVSERAQHSDIEYKALSVAPSDREHAIINVLRFYDAPSAIVFCATREAVNRLSSRFGNRGFAVVALSGELSQKDRTSALQAMRDGRARVCVATDVAARGIDLPGLELVIHADLPTNSDTLLHRSGRTGRAGQKGTCVLIVPHTRRGRAQRLLRDGKIQAEWGNAPSLEDITARDRERVMSDPSLSETYDEDALAMAQELLARYPAEQIAAAFLNRRQADMPSAEELIESPGNYSKDGPGAPEKRREPFGDSVWYRLTAGRKHRAEPRWILPLICRLGHITKREIGAIQIGEEESRFEILASESDRFMDAVQKAGGGEKSIRITRDEGGADAPLDRPRTPRQPAAYTGRPKPGRDGESGKDFTPRPKPYKAKSRDDEAFTAPYTPKAKPRSADSDKPYTPKPRKTEGDKPFAPKGKPRAAEGGAPSKPRTKPFSADRKPGAKSGAPRPSKPWDPAVVASAPVKRRSPTESPAPGAPGHALKKLKKKTKPTGD
ncbi:DEAD/DEAH box helicase [Maricaulis sp.]|uniref:DEAD/DEAH box helicase n=1 Tax=Maricaulis sp. TaxID=1486257 RepID=UPI003A94C3BC